MTGVLFDGEPRRVSNGAIGHLWRDLPAKAWRGHVQPLCGQTWDYPPSRLRADGITRACSACEKAAVRLDRLDRETGRVPSRPDCDLCGRPLKGWATVPPDDPAMDCGGTCQACMNRAEAPFDLMARLRESLGLEAGQ